MFIKFALTTERSVSLIERENKLVFIVDPRASKYDVRKEVEEGYKEKVASVHTLNDLKGRKKAIVKFVRKGAASDVAAKLKLI